MIETPEDIPRLFAEAWNRNDARALADLFAEDAEFVNVVGIWWHNRDAIFKAHDYGLKVIFSESTVKVTKTVVRYVGECKTAAVVHARMKLSGQTSHAGVENPHFRQNVFSFVAEKLTGDSGWICVSAHNTDIVPSQETNIIDEQGRFRSVDYRK